VRAASRSTPIFPPRTLFLICSGVSADGLSRINVGPDVLRWLQVAAAAVFSTPHHSSTHARSILSLPLVAGQDHHVTTYKPTRGPRLKPAKWRKHNLSSSPNPFPLRVLRPRLLRLPSTGVCHHRTSDNDSPLFPNPHSHLTHHRVLGPYNFLRANLSQ